MAPRTSSSSTQRLRGDRSIVANNCRGKKSACFFNKKQAALLTAIAHADSTQRRALLRTADSNFVRSICECVLNILHGVVPLHPRTKRNLRRHAPTLRRLVNDKGGFAKKKKALLQSGGSFLPALLAPLLVEFVSRLASRGSS